jgi:uncharacterized membrane protein YraQ (UPF0718 family)
MPDAQAAAAQRPVAAGNPAGAAAKDPVVGPGNQHVDAELRPDRGPLVGPLVSMASFVCSIGNVPLAAVLWNGGISFGGVIAFIFADLLILPILNIYRRYYGPKMSLFLLGSFYATMAAAGYLVELLFGVLGLVPTGPRHAKVIEATVQLDYTTVLNGLFLALAVVLVVRFVRTGGRQMLKLMNEPMDQADGRQHQHHGTDDAVVGGGQA